MKKPHISEVMKNLENATSISNFATNCQFTRELGVELIRGLATPEHIEVLLLSMEGLLSFIDLLKEKLEEPKGQ